MAVSVDQFVDSLSITGLMTVEEVKALREGVAARKPPPDVETLARELVRSGKLTIFQANAIYKGKAKGLVCGEYVLLSKIGAGGMGQVFKARHKRMNRNVAVKLLAPHTTSGDKGKAVKRFYQEVETAARLIHPNIVVAYDAGESNGLHYLVMECIEGQDLSTALKPDKKLPLDQALQIVLQAAWGLEYAHAQGIVHRDIKPSNLLMDKNGHVKILDMGLARVEDALTGADRAAGAGLTQSGEIMGTVDYMAPEQARNTRNADARADIYSLGCTLYRLTTGRVVFEGQSMVDKFIAHYEKPIPSLGEHCEGVSRRLERVFERMLAKKPEERFQSMTEVIAELEACRVDVPEEEHAPLVIDEPSAENELEGFLSQASDSGSSHDDLLLSPAPRSDRKAVGNRANRRQRGGQSNVEGRNKTRIRMFVGGGLTLLLLIGGVALFLMRGPSSPPATETPPVAQAEPAAASEPARSSSLATIPVPPSDTNLTPGTTPASPPAQPPPQMSKTTVVESSLPAVATAIPPHGIDLLKLVDLNRDVGEGEWRTEGSALVAPVTDKPCRLQFPYAPPPEYDLHIEAETLTDLSFLRIGLVSRPSRVAFNMNQRYKSTVLSQIGGLSDGDNGTVQRGVDGFVSRQPMTLVCQVRPTGILITLNGRLVLDWQGGPQQLSVGKGFAGPDKTKLFLWATGGARFTRYELATPGASPRTQPSSQPSTTPVEVTQSQSLPTKPGVRVNLLRMIDVKRDGKFGEWQIINAALVSPDKNPPSYPRLQIPYELPREYELRVAVEPPAPDSRGVLSFGLPIGRAFANFSLDNQTKDCGLELNSSKSFRENETRRNLRGLMRKDRRTIVCRVRPPEIIVLVDGTTVVSWNGDPAQLSVGNYVSGVGTTKLVIGADYYSNVRIIACELSTLAAPLPLPSPDAIEVASADVKQRIAQLPNDTSIGAKRAHAISLHQEGITTDDDAMRYALLMEASEMAVNADDFKLLLDTLEDLARCFEIDVALMLNAALNKSTSRTRSPVERKELLQKLLEAYEEESAAERYDLAVLLLKSSATVVAKTTDAELKKEIHNRELEVEAAQKLFNLAELARKTLRDQPDDGAANLALGTYLAVTRDQWPIALAHLVKGSDPLVRTAAQTELEGQQDPNRFATIGTLWLDAAEKVELPAKAVYLDRARKWLAQGSSSLKPAELAKLQARYKKADAEVRKLAGSAYVKRHPQGAANYGGHWYQLMPDRMTWQQARQYCQDIGGDLVCLETPAEAQWVYAFAAAQSGMSALSSFWLGASEEGHKGVYTWVNGAALQFSAWGPGEPDSRGGERAILAGRANPAVVQFEWTTSQLVVRAEHRFVCEWDR